MYQDIRRDLARIGRIGLEPRRAEAVMRLEHPTLDGLSAEDFRRGVEIAAQTLNFMSAEDAEALAETYGLGENKIARHAKNGGRR